jgi:hypothetical protein
MYHVLYTILILALNIEMQKKNKKNAQHQGK